MKEVLVGTLKALLALLILAAACYIFKADYNLALPVWLAIEFYIEKERNK